MMFNLGRTLSGTIILYRLLLSSGQLWQDTAGCHRTLCLWVFDCMDTVISLQLFLSYTYNEKKITKLKARL